MGRKPVVQLAGLFLAGVTLTGCECTDWCCGGKSKDTAARPAPTWPTAQQPYQAPATTGYTRTTTPSDPSAVRPTISPAAESTVVAPPTGFQTTSTNSAAKPEIVPPSPPIPSVNPQPTTPLPPLDMPVDSLPAVPRTSTPHFEPAPQVEPPPSVPSAPLPPLDLPAPPKLEGPSNLDEPPPVPAPPKPVAPDKPGSSSSKYQQLIPELPPPPPGVPEMPSGK